VSHDGISLRDNNTYNLAPHLKHSDLALPVRNDPAVEAQLRNIPSQSYSGNPARAAYFVDAACRAEELYALRRIKQIGRRAYALELVERDLARIAARADPLLYLNDEGRAKYLARKKNLETKPHDHRSIRRRHHTPSRKYVFHADQRLDRPRPTVGRAKL
jgi:hypothetical protein